MGWNTGYMVMEQQVISLYNAKLLNKEVLNALMKPFCGTDIDHGGCRDLKSKDGKSADDIICFIMEPQRYRKITENFIPNNEEYNEKLYDLWVKITRQEWKFW